MGSNYLLYYIRTELLNREGADITDELSDNRITETTVVEIENILHNLQRNRQNIPSRKTGGSHNCHKDLGPM
jgi:hypothetical protein